MSLAGGGSGPAGRRSQSGPCSELAILQQRSWLSPRLPAHPAAATSPPGLWPSRLVGETEPVLSKGFRAAAAVAAGRWCSGYNLAFPVSV